MSKVCSKCNYNCSFSKQTSLGRLETRSLGPRQVLDVPLAAPCGVVQRELQAPLFRRRLVRRCGSQKLLVLREQRSKGLTSYALTCRADHQRMALKVRHARELKEDCAEDVAALTNAMHEHRAAREDAETKLAHERQVGCAGHPHAHTAWKSCIVITCRTVVKNSQAELRASLVGKRTV